jgi:hypothetical protein
MTRYEMIVTYLSMRRVKCFWFNSNRFCGLYFDNNVLVNPKVDVLPTICHEVFHALYPKLEEDKIRLMETRFVKRINLIDSATIINIFTRKAKLWMFR